jgi:putative hydrolase of the HAD superfamily
MTIDAVGFDLDGTLYSRGMMYRLSVPLLLCHPRLLLHFGHVRRSLRHLERIDGFRATQARLLAARLRMEEQRAGALIDRVIYGDWMRLLRGIRPFPHVSAALAGLRALGLKLGLLSDYPVEDKLGFLGLRGPWITSFCSEDTGYLKPHRNPFQRLSRDLGVEPRRILYVGDSISFDVRGAAAAGMRTALVGRRDPAADLCFNSYDCLVDMVQERFG